MRKTPFKILILATMTATASLILASTADDGATLNQISGYRQWARVTAEPVAVPVDVASLAG